MIYPPCTKRAGWGTMCIYCPPPKKKNHCTQITPSRRDETPQLNIFHEGYRSIIYLYDRVLQYI